MLITDKNEIVRLKLIHGSARGEIIAFAESYSVNGHYDLNTYIHALFCHNDKDWSTFLVEANGESLQHEGGGYARGHIGSETYIKEVWKEFVAATDPKWRIKWKKKTRIFMEIMKVGEKYVGYR